MSDSAGPGKNCEAVPSAYTRPPCGFREPCRSFSLRKPCCGRTPLLPGCLPVHDTSARSLARPGKDPNSWVFNTWRHLDGRAQPAPRLGATLCLPALRVRHSCARPCCCRCSPSPATTPHRPPRRTFPRSASSWRSRTAWGRASSSPSPRPAVTRCRDWSCSTAPSRSSRWPPVAPPPRWWSRSTPAPRWSTSLTWLKLLHSILSDEPAPYGKYSTRMCLGWLATRSTSTGTLVPGPVAHLSVWFTPSTSGRGEEGHQQRQPLE